MDKLTKAIDRIWELREKIAWRELTPWEQETLVIKELDEIHRDLNDLKSNRAFKVNLDNRGDVVENVKDKPTDKSFYSCAHLFKKEQP